MFQSPEKSSSSDVLRRVLVVDDEPTLRLGFAYALSTRTTLVETASTGRQALEKIAAHSFDVMILDLRMPDIDGIGVIEALREAGNPMPVVLCSAAITPSVTLRALRAQVVDFLLKPVRPADLRDVIDFVLEPAKSIVPKALAAARKGRFEEASRILGSDDEADKTASAWREVVDSLLLPEPDSRELEDLLRTNLSHLAFRSPRKA